MKKYALILFALVFSLSAKSQDNTAPTYQSLERAVLQGVSNQFTIKENIVITNDDKDFFWPLYKEYKSKLEDLNNEYISIYANYASKKNADAIVFSEAMDAYEDMIKIDRDLLKLKRKYFKKMSDKINPVKVVAYFNYEDSLQLKIRLELIKEMSETK